MFLCLECW